MSIRFAAKARSGSFVGNYFAIDLASRSAEVIRVQSAVLWIATAFLAAGAGAPHDGSCEDLPVGDHGFPGQ